MSEPSDAAATGASELVSRIVISVVACGLVTWQLAETANFRPHATWLATEKARRCKRLGGTPLQWYLVSLMLLSALDGLVGVITDLTLLVSEDGGAGPVPVENVQEEIGVQLVLGKLSQLILSLMIIGLGASGWHASLASPTAANGVTRGYYQAATVLGVLSLFVRRLPAPLVLVGGVWFLQRTPKKAARKGKGGGGDADYDDGRARPSDCFSLRCVLRPLLVLAVVEAIYASVVVDDEFRRRMELSKAQAHRIIEAQTARGAAEAGQDAAEAAAMVSMLAVFDSLKPEAMLEMAQQQLGELVQFGTVAALGVSGRYAGLKHTLWPVAAAMIPGLPTSFAVVFYFLLETRQAQGGGTILPLATA